MKPIAAGPARRFLRRRSNMKTRPHFRLHRFRLGFALAALAVAPAAAQEFTSLYDHFDESAPDGILDLSGFPANSTVVLDPDNWYVNADGVAVPPGTANAQQFVLDPDDDNVFHFRSINIPAGMVLKLDAAKLRMLPVYFLVGHIEVDGQAADGTVTINGTIDLSGEAGHSDNGGATVHSPSKPGPGGWPGGVSIPGGVDQDGAGPYGKWTAEGTGWGGPGGPCGDAKCHGRHRGNAFLVPLLGGAGGGANSGYGGGAGGGAILIAASRVINVAGAIKANGGLAGNFGTSGSGAGGAVHLLAPDVVVSGGVEAFSKNGQSQPSVLEEAGGRIRIEERSPDVDVSKLSVGSGKKYVVTLLPNGLHMPPSPAPRVWVHRIGEEIVPSRPSADRAAPDVTIDAAGEVVVELRARSLPDEPGVDPRAALEIYNETMGFKFVEEVRLGLAYDGGVPYYWGTTSVEFDPGVSTLQVFVDWVEP